MGKEGERSYLRNIGEAGRWHAVHKPFSDSQCHVNLEAFGAILACLPPPPARLLDLGCGTGWTSAFFARRGYDVLGVDISGDMIAEADELRDRAGLSNLAFVESDYESLRFREEFDIAVFYDSLHHAVDEGLAVRRAFEALRPGGVCLTHEPGEGHAATAAAVEAVRKYGVTEKDMPPRKIIALGRAAGFRRFQVLPFPHENRLTEYRVDRTTTFLCDDWVGIRPRHPLAGAGWLKRLFHAILRRRLGFSRASYGTFLSQLPQVRAACESHAWGGLPSCGAFVVLVK
jgi:SAM-dependent methyltransferase